MQLTDRKWKEFTLSRLFNIVGSKTTAKTILEASGQGHYPYVTTQTTNNGQCSYHSYYTETGNVLVVDSAVVGFCTYQANNFSASDHVEKLIPNFIMNKYSGIFLTVQINQNNKRKFSYGYKACQDRLYKTKIMLPVNAQGEPDYAFMEDYIKDLMQRKRQEYLDYATRKIKELQISRGGGKIWLIKNGRSFILLNYLLVFNVESV